MRPKVPDGWMRKPKTNKFGIINAGKSYVY